MPPPLELKAEPVESLADICKARMERQERLLALPLEERSAIIFWACAMAMAAMARTIHLATERSEVRFLLVSRLVSAEPRKS